ncbi:MAG: hypothetical protein GY795_44850 [Desulfobacterales bacterium]|nr:hypothetical protein [Desulfobacterales bacterium]
MKVVDKLFDKRINALNALITMNIQEYISVSKSITSKNEFQRARVKRSSSVYQLLREDLKMGCSMPPVVLAVRSEGTENILNPKTITEDRITSLFKPENLIILDGLQRTYTLIDLAEKLEKNEPDKINQFYSQPIRVELYVGLNKIGVLYRMLTLNTGQTPMSTRHQIEILYSDYLNKETEGIRLYTEKDKKRIGKIGDYQFRDVVEGFSAYLDRDELGITRSELLENIQNLEKLSKENNESDLFKDYITSYNYFVQKFDELSNNWELNTDEYKNIKDHILETPFGKNSLSFFTKSQVLSGYGAAVGKLKDFEIINDFQDIKNNINGINFSGDPTETIYTFLENLFEIKNTAKNIGRAQRLYLTYFFRELFNKESDSFLSIKNAVENGFKKYLYEIG